MPPRKSRSKKWEQHSVDPTYVELVTKALKNNNMKKPRCPLPTCEWESYTETNTWHVSANVSAMGRLKRHIRDNHRAYYALAITKPFIIQEEEEVTSWLQTMS